MTYAKKEDIDNLYGEQELLRLAPNPDGTDTVGLTAVKSALEYATGEINKKLARRYQLPFSDISFYLRGVCIDFAIYHLALWRDVLTDENISRYERHLKELNDLRDGKDVLHFDLTKDGEPIPPAVGLNGSKDTKPSGSSGLVSGSWGRS